MANRNIIVILICLRFGLVFLRIESGTFSIFGFVTLHFFSHLALNFKWKAINFSFFFKVLQHPIEISDRSWRNFPSLPWCLGMQIVLVLHDLLSICELYSSENHVFLFICMFVFQFSVYSGPHEGHYIWYFRNILLCPSIDTLLKLHPNSITKTLGQRGKQEHIKYQVSYKEEHIHLHLVLAL